MNVRRGEGREMRLNKETIPSPSYFSKPVRKKCVVRSKLANLAN